MAYPIPCSIEFNSIIFVKILQAVAEILAELFHKFLWPVAGRLQPSHEKSQYWRFFNKSQSAHQIPVIVQPVHPVYHIHRLR